MRNKNIKKNDEMKKVIKKIAKNVKKDDVKLLRVTIK